MRCDEFRDRLDALFALTLDAEMRAEADQHRATCAHCDELWRVVTGETNLLSQDQADGLVSDVLQLTGTNACERACEALWEGSTAGRSSSKQADADIDAGLVALHMEHCGSCAELARILPTLVEDLTDLADVQPDARFATDVLRRTSGARRLSWRERWREAWQSLLQRPRLAWEAAYCATLLVAILTGLPASPLHDVPKQALAHVRVDPVALAEASQHLVSNALTVSHRTLKAAWDATGGNLGSRAERELEAFKSTHPGLSRSWNNLGDHVRQVGTALRTGSFQQLVESFRLLGHDLIDLWRGLVRSSVEDRSAARLVNT